MMFPVHRVGKKRANWEVGIFFPFLFFLFHRQGCTEKKFFKLYKKKFQSALFSPLRRWTGNNFLFKGGLWLRTQRQSILLPLCFGVPALYFLAGGEVVLHAFGNAFILVQDVRVFVSKARTQVGQAQRRVTLKRVGNIHKIAMSLRDNT